MPTVLITGANRGIGLEFVRQYAADKWDVIACCRDPDKAEALQKLAGDAKHVRIEALEVSDPQSLVALTAKLQGAAIDLLINNAGIYAGSADRDKSQTFGTIDDEAWLKVLRVNSVAPIMVIQALRPNLLKGTGKQVANITSRMGAIGEMGGGSIAYRSSKAALNAAMRTIMHDLQPDGIAIANLHPGWVQTDMGGKGAQLSPEQSVTALRQTIAGLSAKNSGSFFNYDGKEIAW